MLIVGPSLIILLLASLFVLFINGMRSRNKGVRVIKEEHLYNRNEEKNTEDLENFKEEEGLYKDKRDEQLYRDKVPAEKKSRAPIRRNNEFFYRDEQPEPECC